jgi:histidine triad (HIT) family protein
MPSIFTKIIRGEIPCAKVYEDDLCLSFLDIRPLNPGHALVIPKEEIDYIFDVEDELLGHLMRVAKRVGLAIDAVVDCERVGVIVAGLEVPHAHIHLVPIRSIKDINFANARLADPGELERLAGMIRERLAAGGGESPTG